MSVKSIAIGFSAAAFFWVFVALVTIDAPGPAPFGLAGVMAIIMLGCALWAYVSSLHHTNVDG